MEAIERRVRFIFAGAVLGLLAVAQPILAWTVRPEWAGGLVAAMLAELVTGREAAIPLALDRAVPPAWVALTSILQNLALACFVVPIVMAAVRQAEEGQGRISKALHRLHETAECQRHKASSAGGIFLFMLVPFLANGPIIAGILGRLLGIDYLRLAVAIALAVVITATAWSFGYAALSGALASVDPRLARVPAFFALAVTAFAVLRLAWGLRASTSRS